MQHFLSTRQKIPLMTGFLPCLGTTFNLLDIEKPPRLCAIDACTIWSSEILRELKVQIEKKFKYCWYQAILDQYSLFISNFQDHFVLTADFRRIGFSRKPISKRSQQLPLDSNYLEKNLRLGFSEWQLYTYFLYTRNRSFLQNRSPGFYSQPHCRGIQY